MALPEQGQDKPVVRGPAASKIAKTGGSTADETTAAPVLGPGWCCMWPASHELLLLSPAGIYMLPSPSPIRRPLAAAGVRRPVAVRGSADGRTDDKREQPGVRRDLSPVSGRSPASTPVQSQQASRSHADRARSIGCSSSSHSTFCPFPRHILHCGCMIRESNVWQDQWTTYRRTHQSYRVSTGDSVLCHLGTVSV